MSKDPFKPIQAKTNNPVKQGYVRRAPIENIMWQPRTPDQLGEALATIVNELHPKSLNWFWRELTSFEQKGDVLKEDVRGGAVDLHFSMFPGGNAAFTPYFDARDAEDWEESGVFPAHLRDFRNNLIKRPDLPMTAKTDGTGTLRRLDRLPQTTAELTAIAYQYGASVPQQLVGSLWNRAQTLFGEALLQPEWVWEPAPIGNFHEAEQKNIGHPIIGDGKMVEDPISELGTTTANPKNFIKQGKTTETGKVMSENKRKLAEEKFNKVFEYLTSTLNEEDYMPYGDDEEEGLDAFGSGSGDTEVSEEDLDALLDASNMKKTQQFLGTDSTISVIQASGRAMGKVLMLMGDKALQQIDPLKLAVAKEFVQLGSTLDLFEKEDVAEMMSNLDLVLELDSFRNFFDAGFLHPMYLVWRNKGKEAVENVLRKSGVQDDVIKKISGRIDRAEVFAADGVPEEGLFKALGGEKLSGQKEMRARDLAKRSWKAIQETTIDDLLDSALGRWEGLSRKKKEDLFMKSFSE
jgi:hypothetical protein